MCVLVWNNIYLGENEVMFLKVTVYYFVEYYSSGRYYMDKRNQKPIDLNYMEKSYSPNCYDFYDI